jgi:hypothetical protein
MASDELESSQHLYGFYRGPGTHALMGSDKLILTGSESPFSSLSAITRRANISAFDIASAAESP